ncbi:MAG: HAD-IA family hydrolase [Spiribacter salinus]|uniref:HAD-IA family hydrolase n=1 Tax=Spiribacter salinus TaxID=1335746 RepID=A0A540VU17_9GAMM|nr:MAG: HAD-IA family hydrolase [Spiribacter salinus]
MTPFALARGVLLDLDGTLFDTAPDLINAMNTLREEQSLPPLPAAEFANAVGHGSAPMIARAFHLSPDHPRFEPLRVRFLELYHESLSAETLPYEGMEPMLETLEAAGVPWGIVTNKPGWLTRPLINELGYHERPDCLVTGDDIALRKPHPHQVLEGCRRLGLAPAECVVVGDAERDIQAGRGAGTMTLAALYGYLSGDDHAERWGADGLISHPLETLRWVDLGVASTAQSATA